MGAALAYKYDYLEGAYFEKASKKIETRVLTPRPYKIRLGENAFVFNSFLPDRTPEIKKVEGFHFTLVVSQLSWKNIIKTRINRTVRIQKFHGWGESKPSEKTLCHAHKLVDLCEDDNVLCRAEVTTGGNGTIMLTWSKQDVLATLDVGETTFTYSVIRRNDYQRLGGGKFNAMSDTKVYELYHLLG